MAIKIKKRPWNPFPLASLSVAGLTACAKTVLIYLAARSNHKGETCVGHRTMCRELVRSKDFVTTGLAELAEKGLVKEADRNRAKGEAMWRTLDKSVLDSRTAKPESQSCPAGLNSPEEQDFVSPAQQGKTLQISTTSNLADQFNLAEKEGNKEGTGLAPLDPVAVTAEKQTYIGEQDTEETAHLWDIWAKGSKTKHGYFRFTDDGSMDEVRDAKELIAQHGLEPATGYLADTFNCPKTAKVLWEDFHFWARQFPLTKKNIDAWRRVTTPKNVSTLGTKTERCS